MNEILRRCRTIAITLYFFTYFHDTATPTIEKELQDVITPEGKDVQFEARCFSKPEADYMWLMDDQRMAANDRFVSSKKDNLIVLKVNKAQRNDAGKITLVASNSIGETKTSAMLSVTGIDLKCTSLPFLKNLICRAAWSWLHLNNLQNIMRVMFKIEIYVFSATQLFKMF